MKQSQRFNKLSKDAEVIGWTNSSELERLQIHLDWRNAYFCLVYSISTQD